MEIIATYMSTNNVGDFYSSPVKYYKMKNGFKYINFHNLSSLNKKELTKVVSGKTVIVGGGGLLNHNSAWNRLILNLNELASPLIIWGAGTNAHSKNRKGLFSSGNSINLLKKMACRSIKKLRHGDIINLDLYKKIDVIESIKHENIICGLRDFELSNENNHIYFVPCSSCMLDCIKQTGHVSRRIGVINHFFKPPIKIDQDSICMDLRRQKIQDIIQFINSSEFIITNSYHGMYWATLMKKRVLLTQAFSNKFDYFKWSPVWVENFNSLNNELEKSKSYADALEESRERNNYFWQMVQEIL